jgi:gliding motility-associated-like protein
LCCFILVAGLAPFATFAQLSAPGSDYTDKTNYPVFQGTDSIYIFCANEGESAGRLVATTKLTAEKKFVWEKFNNLFNRFEPYSQETITQNQSTISNLADGCYRVTITKGDTTQIYRAWVLNNWFVVSTSVTESNCDFFKLGGDFTSASLIYYDLVDTTQIQLLKDIKVEWKRGNDLIAKVKNPQVYDPPTSDTKYKLYVSDRFGCGANSEVTYVSIVTKASFDVDADFSTGEQQGEAPLIVTFKNTSENGTPGQYEWFFFRDMNTIKNESENSNETVDSIMFVAYNDELIYTYENTGNYMVKLVSKKISQFHTCTDTFYLEDYIVTDSSYFDVPNFFSPNGDGTNDMFVVKYWSMLKVKISITNRWGRLVHVWENDEVRGFSGTWTESVWDGKLNGRYASPGVYYYVIEGTGRDGVKRWKHGFFHLFRGKD